MRIIVLSLILIVANASNTLSQSAREILYRVFEETREIETISYVMTKSERIEGEMIKQISSSKIQRNPLRVYLRQQYPKDGLEVLYTEENDKALINPNGFPWINLRLSPNGGTMRENQHHTIKESGYDHFINVLEHLITKYDGSLDNMLVLKPDTVFDGNPAWSIALNNPNYQLEYYTMQKGETIMEVARRKMLSEYWLIERNDKVSDCKDELPGEVIRITNDYSPKMELIIDSKRYIPLVMKVYDDKGLYEHYSYSDVEINPAFLPEEFDRNYKEYGF
ncbi:MAG: DUF1571 domain-containing protein [Cyclobacteriaceae bacterium]